MISLEDAIGCWTTNREYGSLDVRATLILSSARFCRRKTLKGDPHTLLPELRLLRSRLESMMEITDGAIRRCEEIIADNLCSPTRDL